MIINDLYEHGGVHPPLWTLRIGDPLPLHRNAHGHPNTHSWHCSSRPHWLTGPERWVRPPQKNRRADPSESGNVTWRTSQVSVTSTHPLRFPWDFSLKFSEYMLIGSESSKPPLHHDVRNNFNFPKTWVCLKRCSPHIPWFMFPVWTAFCSGRTPSLPHLRRPPASVDISPSALSSVWKGHGCRW